MAWLLRGGDVLASLEVAENLADRTRQLLGRRLGPSALLVCGSRTAHSLGVRSELDVAYLDDKLRVLGVTVLAPNRIGLPRPGSKSVLLAAGGAFERWTLRPGDQLEIKR